VADIRLSDLWDGVRTRVNSAMMQTVLGGAARVYVEGEDYGDAEGPESAPWGRVVIVPASTLWDDIDDPSDLRRIAFLIRAEFNDFRGAGYRPGVSLEAAQAEAYNQLYRWTPALTTYRAVVVALPFYRWTRPQPLPLWDEERALWWTSSQWRTQVTNK
jgi:hypothetical protein